MSMSDKVAERRWNHAGLECAMIGSGIGFINGYVRLPEDHVARHAGYDEINRTIEAHGGFTYGVDEDGWIGFDTGHSGDYWPSIPSNLRTYEDVSWARAWTFGDLQAEVERVADQLAAMREIGDPTSSYDCTEAEFQALLADAKAWREHQAALVR